MRSRNRLRFVIPSLLLLAGSAPMLAPPALAMQGNARRDDSDAADRARRSAHGLLQRGLLDAAIEEYRTALRLAPRHELADDARYGLAVALSRLEKYEDAIDALEDIRFDNQAFRYRAEAKYLEGRAYLSLNRLDEAQRAFFETSAVDAAHNLTGPALVASIEIASRREDDRFVTTHAPKLLETAGNGAAAQRVRYALGLALHRTGKTKETIAALNPLIESKESDPALAARGAYLVAQAHERLGDREAALGVYERAGRSDQTEIAAAARYARAFLLEELNRKDDAMRAMADVLRDLPDDPQAPAGRLHLAVMLINAKQPDAAAPLLAALEDDASYGDEAAYWRAKADLATGKFDDAASRLANARTRHEASELAPDMLYDEAIALFRAKKAKPAAQRFDEFANSYPKHKLAPEAIRMAANLWHEAEDYNASFARCEAYLKQAPKDDEHRPALALLAGENLLISNRVEDAAKQYRAVRGAYPKSAQAIVAARREGESLVRLGRADDAIKVLREAVAQTDDDMDRALVQRWLGDAAFTAGDWQLVESSLSEALPKIDPKITPRASLWLKLGLAQARLKKHDEALASFEAVQKETEDGALRAQAMFERGQSLVELDRDDEAEKAFQQTIRAEAGQRFVSHAWNHLGAIAERKESFVDAVRAYESAAKDESLRAEATWRLASVLERAGEMNEAAKAWQRAAGVQSDQRRATEAALRGVLAVAREGDAERTLEALSKLPAEMIAAAPGSLRGSIRYEQAWSLKRLGRREEARPVYAALLSDDSADRSLHQYATLDLADLDLLDEKYEDAWKRLEPLLKLGLDEKTELKDDIRRAIALRAGQAAFALKQYDDAQVAYALALEHLDEDDAQYADVVLTAGESAFRAERWKETIETLKPLRDEKDLPPMTREPILLRLGEAYAQVQNWEDSRETFALHREAFPKSAFWHQAAFGIAWADENAGKHKEAMERYREIADRHDGVTAARAQFQIGECLFAQRRYDEALKEFMKVDILFAAPEWSAAALVEAGRVLEALRRPDEARVQFEAVVERYPDGEWAKIARERLRALSSTPGGANSRGSGEEER